jgi:hypothetical protein
MPSLWVLLQFKLLPDPKVHEKAADSFLSTLLEAQKF